ncbi:MAG: GCN5 family acetyltransferase [Methylibium sp. NZG]|nr:MAG: GCN5 family acetyltransferase [Methylibium sp. NZG]
MDEPNPAMPISDSARPPMPAPASTLVAAVEPAPLNWTWVPIRSLGARQRDRVAAHLLALSEGDRYLRFGYPATDAQINRYVDSMDFERDEVFGIFNRHLELIAVAHLAHPVAPTGATDIARIAPGPPMAEFGVSVLPKARGRGFGRRLFEHAVLHARNRGVQTLFIHALSENVAMLKIARDAGATVEREGSESEAWLKLPPDTLASHVGEMVEKNAAELDYRLKVRARQVSELLDGFSEVRAKMGHQERGPET